VPPCELTRGAACGITLALVVGAVVAFAQQAAPAQGLAATLQTSLDEWRASAGAPGASLGVVLKDGQVFGLASGLADRATNRALTPDDLLMTGSTGKTFFAAVALQLIEAGTLDLGAPVSKYLGTKPWFSRLPNANDISVRMLMTHTSGLVRYEMNPKFTADLRANPDKAWTPEEEIAYLLDAPPPFAAGQGWDYSDTNYIVLGMIMEGLTGTKPYDEVQRRFLEPLQLSRVAPTTSRRVPGLAPGYAGPRDPLGLPDEVMTNGVFVINPQFEWTGGGESTYGLGVIVRPTTPAGPAWGHSGFFPGYQTELVYFPDSGVTVAVQINSSAPRTPGSRTPLRFAYDVAGISSHGGTE